jgi:alginate O-acetyltransferase complex protein AlgI
VLFPTLAFAVFLSLVLPGSWALAHRRSAWKLFLLAASWVFYGWWDIRCLGLLIGSGWANHHLGERIAGAAGPRTRRAWLILGVALDLGVLAYFKYARFFLESLASLSGSVRLEDAASTLHVLLPVGISFYTFHGISYLVDVYRGTARPTSLLNFSLYAAFFPHLVAGPIVRAAELAPQLDRGPDSRAVDLGRALPLILGGLFKKLVVADALGAQLVDPVFAAPWDYASPSVWLAGYGYALQIFADFSAYTDIAIGVAALIGLEFPQNFDNPYASRSLQEFWRRWHMTLSRFLRDYLYIPLGGGRLGAGRTMLNLFLTMLIGGLWHGASWMFVIWGALHGTGLVVERLFYERLLRRPIGQGGAWAALVQRFATFHLVATAWVFFRADSVETATLFFRALFTQGLEFPHLAGRTWLALAAGYAAMAIPARLDAALSRRIDRASAPALALVMGVGLVVIDALGPSGVAAFIYFQF